MSGITKDEPIDLTTDEELVYDLNKTPEQEDSERSKMYKNLKEPILEDKFDMMPMKYTTEIDSSDDDITFKRESDDTADTETFEEFNERIDRDQDTYYQTHSDEDRGYLPDLEKKKKEEEVILSKRKVVKAPRLATARKVVTDSKFSKRKYNVTEEIDQMLANDPIPTHVDYSKFDSKKYPEVFTTAKMYYEDKEICDRTDYVLLKQSNFALHQYDVRKNNYYKGFVGTLFCYGCSYIVDIWPSTQPVEAYVDKCFYCGNKLKGAELKRMVQQLSEGRKKAMGSKHIMRFKVEKHM